VVGWALRWALLCCGIVLLVVGLLDRIALSPERPSPAQRQEQADRSAPRGSATAPNTAVYAANDRGHVVLEAAVNGAPLRMLVDTGAAW
jgi:predicted aspartyl protease